MAKLEDLVEELREDGREDDAELLEKLSGSSLRKKAEAADKYEREATELRLKVEKLEHQPKVRSAFEDAGVDLSSLSKLERKAIENYDGEIDKDSIGSFLEDNEIAFEIEEEGSGPTAAEQVTQAARQAPEGRSRKAPALTPEDVSAWPMEKKMRFMESHPDEWEALKRNETVVGVTG